MSNIGVWYVTREEVASSPDIKASAYASTAIDRAIESASRSAERLTHRTFYPWTGTRYLDYPSGASARYQQGFWLNADEAHSLTTFVSGGTTIASTDYFLEPVNDGPPYSSLMIDRASSAALGVGDTAQRSQVLTGVFGGPCDEQSLSTLSAAVSSTSATTLTANAPLGVGSLIKIDSERLIVTEKAFTTMAQTGSLTLSNAAQALTVSDGTVFAVGDELILDAERVLVQAIAGNVLTVQRAVAGSVLAAHTTATIYAARTFTVTRGAAGTTAATHLDDAAITRNQAPGPVRELCLAYTLEAFFQAGSGYARTVGSGDGERQASGRAISTLEERVRATYARRRIGRS